MSPPAVEYTVKDLGFPRVSGDEPEAVERILSVDTFSPRERG